MKNKLLILILLMATPVMAAQQTLDKSTTLPANFTHGDYRSLMDDNVGKDNANFTELFNLPSYSISSSDISGWNAKQNRVSGVCGTGYAIRTVNVDGSVTCEATGGGGVSTWLGLTDTPGSYTANYWVKVNSAGTGLELTTAPSGGGDMLLGTAQTITANKTYSDAAAALFGNDGDWSISSSTAGKLDVASNSATDTVIDIVNSGVGSANMTLHGTFTADDYASPQTSSGPQFTVFREDSDNGTNYVGWGSQASNNNDLVLLLPATDPTANQVLQFASPSPVTFSDGVTRDASVGSWVTMVGGSSLYIATPPTYSDEACTPGSYAFDTGYIYDCVSSGDWNRIATTDWNNPTPTTYTMTLGVAGNGTISINSTDYTSTGSPHTINGLSGTVTMTAAYGSGEDTLTWSGTDSGDVSGAYPTYQINMNAAKNISADFSVTSAVLDDFNRADGALGANWTDSANPVVVSSNQARASVNSTYSFSSYTSSSYNDNQWASGLLSDGADYSGVTCRMDANFNGYAAIAVSNTTAAIYKIVNGAIDSNLSGGTQAVSDVTGQKIRIECSGVTITGYVGGAQFSSITDSSFTAGSIGITAKSDWKAGVDDFSGGNL